MNNKGSSLSVPKYNFDTENYSYNKYLTWDFIIIYNSIYYYNNYDVRIGIFVVCDMRTYLCFYVAHYCHLYNIEL